MRSDMSKILVGRPRIGRSMKNAETTRGRAAETRARHADEYAVLPRTATIKPRQGSRKWLNENLAPLKRFLRCRVGRPWDDVYSELRAHLSPKSAIDMHIMEHLYQFVSLYPEVSADGIRLLGSPNSWVGPFYVDPHDHALHATPRQFRWRYVKQRAPRLADRFRRIDRGDGLYYLRIEGQWYAVETGPAAQYGWDVVRRHSVNRNDPTQEAERRDLYGRRDRVAIAKRQLGKRDLAKAGLR